MRVITDLFTLRPIQKKDAPAMYDYAKRSDVGPKAGWFPHASLYETKAVIKQMMKKSESATGVFAITIDDVLIGTIDIHKIKPGHRGEIGFVLHPSYHRQGIMTLAAQIMIIYAFEELELKRLVYAHFVDNIPSSNLASKLGFHFEGIAKNGYRFQDGSCKDSVINAMTDYDYKKNYKDVYHPLKERLIIL